MKYSTLLFSVRGISDSGRSFSGRLSSKSGTPLPARPGRIPQTGEFELPVETCLTGKRGQKSDAPFRSGRKSLRPSRQLVCKPTLRQRGSGSRQHRKGKHYHL